MVDNTTDKNFELNDEMVENNIFIEVRVDGVCNKLDFPFKGIQKCGCGITFEKEIKSIDGLKRAINYSKVHNKISETFCKKIVKFVEISKEGFLVDGNLVNLMEHVIESNGDISIRIDSDKLKIKNVGNSVKYMPSSYKEEYLPLYHEYVDSLIDIYKVKTIKANSIGIEEVWTWENFYNRKGESTIHSMLLQKDSMLTKNDYIAIMDYLKARTRVERNEIVPRRDCVNLLNGILEFSSGKVIFTPRNKMSDFSEYNFIDILPVKYDPNAMSPEIDRIIGEILKLDEVELFYEIIAYAFINDSRFKKAFILAGKPNTGKTTLLNIIVNLFGEYNISSVSLYQMDPSKNTFAGSDLDGVRLNIVDEMPNITVKNVEIFKNASGGAIGFRVEKKHKDGYNIKPYAKHIFTANELPTVEDEISESFFSRIIIIILEHVFESADGDLDSLKDKKFSEAEKSGLLNHVICALERLLKSREFTYDSDPEEIWNEYRIKYNQNSLRHFVDTVINKDSNMGWVRKEFLYQYYQLFCNKKGIIPLNKNLFGRNMKKLGFRECRPESGEKRYYAWSGISLKENYFVPYFETKYPNKDFHWQSNEEYKVIVTYECNSCRNETYHSGSFSGVDNSYNLKFVCDKCGNDMFSVINVHWKGSDFTKSEFEEYRKNKDKIILGHNEMMTIEEFDKFVNTNQAVKSILNRMDDELRGVEIEK